MLEAAGKADEGWMLEADEGWMLLEADGVWAVLGRCGAGCCW